MSNERPRPVELGHLSLKELQTYGFKHSAELGYRREVARRMSKAKGAKSVLFFDDVSMIVPDSQKQNLAGYQTSLLPALLAASGFENGATVLVGAPPNPVEMSLVHKLKKLMEAELDEPIQYRMFQEKDGQLIDLMQLNAET